MIYKRAESAIHFQLPDLCESIPRLAETQHHLCPGNEICSNNIPQQSCFSRTGRSVHRKDIPSFLFGKPVKNRVYSKLLHQTKRISRRPAPIRVSHRPHGLFQYCNLCIQIHPLTAVVQASLHILFKSSREFSCYALVYNILQVTDKKAIQNISIAFRNLAFSGNHFFFPLTINFQIGLPAPTDSLYDHFLKDTKRRGTQFLG